MSDSPSRRYWDANVFIAALSAEQGRVEKLRPVLKAAERGETEILTSVVTLTEVVNPRRSHTPRGEELDRTIDAFFRHDFIIVVPLGESMARRAREFCREYGLKPLDAIHLATAIIADAERLETFDQRLLDVQRNDIVVHEPCWDGNIPMDFE